MKEVIRFHNDMHQLIMIVIVIVISICHASLLNCCTRQTSFPLAVATVLFPEDHCRCSKPLGKREAVRLHSSMHKSIVTVIVL